ncbi:(deoxy)nucleoside triphosphate pyrophosphohydrolase [Pseudobdellovibrio exovorus]|uniref:8-oxo-dGTP diphosphatase n=1 Tax=Pseudobdellovibrio exovorus JSS TaxID=1184267 RepID=M4V6R2_9BACT|nr:(deoxy)nucleoside triphosphate pyrophosphohydrolase [Pseudobdellovibrio exovorus]AGH94893.1 pyrophosphohydrolase [Pseudobdellovibrio exovorus JSS]
MRHGKQGTQHPQNSESRGKSRVKKNWIPVSAGILKKDNLILVGQRPENHTLAGLWEFPGGKIELGESPEEALVRELNEELGIIAEVGDLKIACTHSYSDVGIIILFYEVLFWKGEPKTQHHINLKWVKPSELPQMNIPDANRRNLDRIYKAFDLKMDT